MPRYRTSSGVVVNVAEDKANRLGFKPVDAAASTRRRPKKQQTKETATEQPEPTVTAEQSD